MSPMLSSYRLTSGIKMVLMIDLSARFHRRKVLSVILPRLGFKIERGTIKSEVRMMFLFQSTLRPCGLKLSARILRLDLTSFGCSAMMLKLLSVSTKRPGEVPAAAMQTLVFSTNQKSCKVMLTAQVCNKKPSVIRTISR